jgi:glycosyltransferase involved in cell wall biosynthesis
MAGSDITLTGRVSSEKLADLFTHARGYLFAAEEDFGIATVEAQSYGLPVIAYARGGTAEIVSDEAAGVLFDAQTVQSVIEAIESFERRETGFDRAVIQRSAQRFGKARFMREMEQLLLDSVGLA